MADPRDVEGTKICRKEFIKHHVDVSRCDIRCSHGVVYIRGLIQPEKGAAYESVEEETLRIARLLRQRPMVRDVVVDARYLGGL